MNDLLHMFHGEDGNRPASARSVTFVPMLFENILSPRGERALDIHSFVGIEEDDRRTEDDFVAILDDLFGDLVAVDVACPVSSGLGRLDTLAASNACLRQRNR